MHIGHLSPFLDRQAQQRRYEFMQIGYLYWFKLQRTLKL